jgi:uncharacterized protein (TIGR00299 family) protein
MTRVAWFHCFNGVAGDMTLAALLDAGASVEAVRDAVAALGLDGWNVEPCRTQRCGIAATFAGVQVDDHADAHAGHEHEHGHDADDHHQHHRSFAHIRDLIDAADLPARLARRALAVFTALAEVEGAIHGVAPHDVEFHEVGALDAIVDVVGTCAALESLGVDEVRCSPIAVGLGTFHAAHGILPNPGPATLGLLSRVGAPAHGVDLDLELTTPTGAALMTALAVAFGAMPAMTVESVGYGAGARDIDGRPNVVQVVVGTSAEATTATEPGQPVRLLEANVDDVTAEVLAHTVSALLAAGAHDAWITPIVMKKGRPAHTIHVLCDPATAGRLSEIVVAETGTLGLRGSTLERWPQGRTDDVVVVDGQRVRVKRGRGRVKVEHDDAASAATALGLPLRDVLRRAEQAALAEPRNGGQPAGR